MQDIVIRTTKGLARHAPAAFALALCYLLWRHAVALDWSAVAEAFVHIPAWRWIAASAATVLSFLAIAQYEVIAHRHLRTGYSDSRARGAGAAAIAVGQTTGFGPVVGAALRWRCMPDLGHAQVMRITGFVTLCFLVAWCVLALTVAAPTLLGIGWLACVALPVGSLAVFAILLRVPRLHVFGQRIDLPSLMAFAKMLGLAAADLCLAGLALHLLLPPDLAPSLPVLIAAFTMALGAGMLGGTPGGVGPFDLALFSLLPQGHAPELVAALLAFRMVYYVAPCILGALYVLSSQSYRRPGRVKDAASSVTRLFDPRRTGRSSCSTSATRPELHERTLPRAEHALAVQSDSCQVTTPEAEAIALRTPQSLMLFLGPTRGSITALLPALYRAARSENRLPCLYKLTARDAAKVRRAGWQTLAFAREVRILPARHTLEGADHRQLRRFLRKSDAAGVRFRPIESRNWEELTTLHCAWTDSHGPERGLTMGRFCPLYLADKPMFGAYLDGKLIAFTSWLDAPGVRSLDLMRHGPDIPTGTMHGLIQHVIEDARQAGIEEITLAALPHPALPLRMGDAEGLARFKLSFSRTWRPLYMAAPDRLSLALCSLDIRGSILRPPPLHRSLDDIWRLDALVDAQAPKVEATRESASRPDHLRRAG